MSGGWSRRGWLRGSGLALVGAGAALGSLAWPRLAAAHPYHVTLTRGRHNRAQGTLELSLRAAPEDLMAGLGRANPRLAHDGSVDIDALEGDLVDLMSSAYLREHFVVLDPEAKPCPHALLGHELDLRWAWLHFQVAVGKSEDLAGFNFQNRVFMEIVPSQTNTLVLEHGGRRETLTFRRGTEGHTLPARA